ncbi:MAG: hypothetical protein N2446_01270 [Elusimicrobiales bacterium]|nr:hypothetical protein [Elusimicrobiales bacterium]
MPDLLTVLNVVILKFLLLPFLFFLLLIIYKKEKNVKEIFHISVIYFVIFTIILDIILLFFENEGIYKKKLPQYIALTITKKEILLAQKLGIDYYEKTINQNKNIIIARDFNNNLFLIHLGDNKTLDINNPYSDDEIIYLGNKKDIPKKDISLLNIKYDVPKN